MSFFKTLWIRAEGIIDPFGDTGEATLPSEGWRFILFFARQAKGPFMLLLVIGGLAGMIDAALYWAVGWLVDLLNAANPLTLVHDHWPALLGLLVLVLVVRAAVIIANAIVEQQVIVPHFYQLVRWQSFQRVIEQPYDFYQNDFAGRIATKIMQAGESTGDFIISSLQTLWSFATFLVLATTILAALDPAMVLVIAIWFASYLAVARFLLPPLRGAGRRTADARSVMNGRMVDAFTNILAVKVSWRCGSSASVSWHGGTCR